MKKIYLLLPLIVFLAISCNFKKFVKINSGEEQKSPPLPLALESLKNSNYRFEVKELADVYSKDSFKLTNGIYYFALPQGASRDEYLAKLDEKKVAFGDLDNDGKSDAAVIITSMAGKGRVFQTLAVMLDKQGAAEYAGGAQLEQGAAVDSIAIHGGKIEVGIKTSENSEIKIATYRLDGSGLVKE